MGRPLGPLGRPAPVTYPASVFEAPAEPLGPLPVFLTVLEVAGMLRVSKTTVYRLHLDGDLPGTVRIGRSVRIPETAVHRYVDNHPALQF